MLYEASVRAQLMKEIECLIQHAHRILLATSRISFLDLGITARQAKTLLALRGAHVKTNVDISSLFKINSGAITRLVDGLEKKALISRAPSMGDRRKRTIELTPAGVYLAEQISTTANTCSPVLSRLTIEELSSLQALLQKLTLC